MEYCTEKRPSRTSSFQSWESQQGSELSQPGDRRLGALGSKSQESEHCLLLLLQVGQGAFAVICLFF